MASTVYETEICSDDAFCGNSASFQSRFDLFDSGGKSEYHGIKYCSVVDVIIFIQQFNGLLLLLELNETDRLLKSVKLNSLVIA